MSKLKQRYRAFISYSSEDAKLAVALEAGLARFARSMFERRALEVFRDANHLPLSPDLWGEIEVALAASECLVCLLSPSAAASEWVRDELDWWIANRGVSKLFLVLVDGSLEWSNEAESFAEHQSTALPRSLLKAFPAEPIYLDLRWARAFSDIDLNHATFRDAVASVSATIRGVTKDELIAVDLFEHKKATRYRRILIASLLVSLVLALTQSVRATIEASRSRDAARLLVAGQLTARPARRVAALREIEDDASSRWREQAVAVLSAPVPAKDVSINVSLDNVSITSERDALVFSAKDDVYRVRLDDFSKRVYRGHVNSVQWVRPSPDGERIVSIDHSHHTGVRLWNADSVKTAQILDHEEPPYGAWFVPGATLAIVTAGYDGTVRLWDLTKKTTTRLSEAMPLIQSLDVSTDGAEIAFARQGDTQGELHELPESAARQAFSNTEALLRVVKFSADGGLLAGGFNNGIIKLLDVDDGIETTVDGFHQGIEGLAFDPSGVRLAAWSDKDVSLVSDSSEAQVEHLGSTAATLKNVVFSLDGLKVIAVADDGSVTLWDLAREKRQTTLAGPGSGITFADFADDETVVTAGAESVQLWKFGGCGPFQELPGHKGRIVSLAFDPQGRFLMSAAFDGRVLLSSLSSAFKSRQLIGPQRQVTIARLDPSGDHVAVGYYSGEVLVWASASGERVVLAGHHESVRGMEFSNDGRLLATTSRDGTATVWEAATGKRVQELQLPDEHVPLRAVAFDALGLNVAVAADDEIARVFSVAEGIQINGVARHIGPITALQFHPDGVRLLTGSDDGTAKVSKLGERGTTARVFRTLAPALSENAPDLRPASSPEQEDYLLAAAAIPGERGLTTARFTRNGSHLLTASRDGAVSIWEDDPDQEGGATPLATMDGSDYPVWDAQFLGEDESLVASASEDGFVRIWPWKTNEAVSKIDVEATTLAVAADHRTIAVGNRRGNIYLWRVESPAWRDALWASTSHCFDATERVRLFNEDPGLAARSADDCRRRVEDKNETLALCPGGALSWPSEAVSGPAGYTEDELRERQLRAAAKDDPVATARINAFKNAPRKKTKAKRKSILDLPLSCKAGTASGMGGEQTAWCSEFAAKTDATGRPWPNGLFVFFPDTPAPKTLKLPWCSCVPTGGPFTINEVNALAYLATVEQLVGEGEAAEEH